MKLQKRIYLGLVISPLPILLYCFSVLPLFLSYIFFIIIQAVLIIPPLSKIEENNYGHDKKNILKYIGLYAIEAVVSAYPMYLCFLLDLIDDQHNWFDAKTINLWISSVVLILIVCYIKGLVDDYMHFDEREKIWTEYSSEDNTVQTNMYSKLKNKYGNISHDIQYNSNDINLSNHFIVFGDSKILYVNNTIIPFSNIISYSVDVDHENIPQTAKIYSSSKTSDIIGRSILGGVLAGPTGAIIGGSTAKRQANLAVDNSCQGISEIIIKIIVRDISAPVQKIFLKGMYINKEEIITSILEVVIHQNKNTDTNVRNE